MAFAKNIRPDLNGFAGNAFDRIAAASRHKDRYLRCESAARSDRSAPGPSLPAATDVSRRRCCVLRHAFSLVPDRRLRSDYNSINAGKFHICRCRGRACQNSGKEANERLSRGRAALGGRARLSTTFSATGTTPSPETLAQIVDAAVARTRARRQNCRRPPQEAPIRAWQGDGKRHWVLAVQLYASALAAQLGHRRFQRSCRI